MHTIAYYAAINKNGMMSLSEKTGDPHAKWNKPSSTGPILHVSLICGT
jgi:hypothetical protein